MLVLRGVMWTFYFPHGKHICTIWWHGISTNSGIPMDINSAPLIADLGPQSLCNQSFWWRFYVVTLVFGFFCGCRGFCHRTESDLFLFLLYCYERDFMFDLQKPKRFNLIDMFNDTSRYLDDIFTIDNPEIEKLIPDISPAELQLNKTNNSDKDTSFLDLNLKVIGIDILTSVYDKRDDFGDPIVNFPWLSGDVVLVFWISILKISKLLRNCWQRVIDITSFEKYLESSLDHTLNFCRNLVIFRSQDMCQKESLTRSSTVI